MNCWPLQEQGRLEIEEQSYWLWACREFRLQAFLDSILKATERRCVESFLGQRKCLTGLHREIPI